MRRGGILAVAVAAALLTPGVLAAQPDIVVVVTDDLDSQMLQDAVSRGFMPNLKSRIIDQGATFTNSFVTDPLCGPARATLLTGQYPHNHGVLGNALPVGGVSKLDDSQTLATWLSSAGYQTALVGKYVNGYGTDIDQTYLPPGWSDWHGQIHAENTRYLLNDRGVVTPMGFSDAEYPTDVFASRAESFIASTTSPYFLYVATLTPHTEQWSPTCEANDGFAHMTSPAPRHMGLAAAVDLPRGAAFNESDLSDKPRWWNKTYPAMSEVNDDCMTTAYRAAVESLMGIDDLLGRLFAATDARGTTANTIFVFTSDNGFLYGQHRGREKESVYEEAIRVPLYVTGPGIGVQTVAGAVLNNDLAPTICEWAGTEPAIAVDGRSFVPLLAGHAPWRTRFMAEHAAEDKPGWLMVRVDSRGRVAKYARYNSKAEELYDLVLDPAELASKHADPHYAGWKKTLKNQLNVLKSCSAASCAAVEDIP